MKHLIHLNNKIATVVGAVISLLLLIYIFLFAYAVLDVNAFLDVLKIGYDPDNARSVWSYIANFCVYSFVFMVFYVWARKIDEKHFRIARNKKNFG